MLVRAFTGEQEIHIHRREVRIGQMLVAVVMRARHRRGDQVQALGGPVPESRKIEPVENMQHLD